MAASLIEVLARRLDLSEEQAAQRLHAFVSKIKRQAERDGSAAVPELGVFSSSGDGLKFEPTDALARTVNRAFAELDPLDLSPEPAPEPSSEERPTPIAAPNAPAEEAEEEAPEEEEAPAEEAYSLEEPSDPTGEELEEQSSTSIFAPSESSSPGTLRDAPAQDSAFGPSAAGASEASPSREPPAAKAEDTPPSPSSSERSETTEPPAREDAPERTAAAGASAAEASAASGATSAPAERARRRDRASKKRPSEERGSGGSGLGWLAAVILLLALGLGVWYVLGQQGIVERPSASSEQPTAASEGNAPNAASSANASPSPAADTSQGSAPTGRGAGGEPKRSAWAETERIDRAAGGWTIIVASKSSRAQADTTARAFAERFSDASYPIDVLEGAAGGSTRHRVAVGQFSSRAAAQQALEDLRDQLPDDAWTLRVSSGG